MAIPRAAGNPRHPTLEAGVPALFAGPWCECERIRIHISRHLQSTHLRMASAPPYRNHAVIAHTACRARRERSKHRSKLTVARAGRRARPLVRSNRTAVVLCAASSRARDMHDMRVAPRRAPRAASPCRALPYSICTPPMRGGVREGAQSVRERVGRRGCRASLRPRSPPFPRDEPLRS